MAYLQRLSALLRLGEPVRDVLLYLPTSDAYARLGTATSLDLWRTLAAMIDPQVIASLRSAGYDLALLDDGLAAVVEPADEPRRAAAGSDHRACREPRPGWTAWRPPVVGCSPSTATMTRRPWSVGTSLPI